MRVEVCIESVHGARARFGKETESNKTSVPTTGATATWNNVNVHAEVRIRKCGRGAARARWGRETESNKTSVPPTGITSK